MTILDFIVILLFIVIIGVSQVLLYCKEQKNKQKVDGNRQNASQQQENIVLSKIDIFYQKYDKVIWVIFTIILLITVIYKFGEFPTYIGVDEAGMAYDAVNLANFGEDRYMNSYPLYLTNFGSGQSVLCGYLAVIFIKILRLIFLYQKLKIKKQQYYLHFVSLLVHGIL